MITIRQKHGASRKRKETLTAPHSVLSDAKANIKLHGREYILQYRYGWYRHVATPYEKNDRGEIGVGTRKCIFGRLLGLHVQLGDSCQASYYFFKILARFFKGSLFFDDLIWFRDAKKVGTNVCCSTCRFQTDRERGQFAAGSGGESVYFIFHFLERLIDRLSNRQR